MKTTMKTLLLTLLLAGLITPVLRADETTDLMQTILQASPTERAKAQKMASSAPRKTSGAKKSSASGGSSLVPNLGIPESQLLEVNSKFPKDFVGKYVYGPVSFKSISQEGNDVCITFTAKGYRGFNFYTKDPAVIQTFSQCGWGTKFNIPKECPLRILTKELFDYVVRLPFDQDTTTHTIGEQIQQGFQ